jgi:transcriptional regulator with XRE-family HTH domain
MILSAKNKQQQYECPICGYDEMADAPEAGEICPCCGTQFDSEGFDCPYQELRSDWIDRYMPWFSRGRKPPKDWNPYRQLIIAEHGSDLTAHPRFRTDLDYRSAVNKAFSEVRIAKQLKVLRETRDVPLTQVQLANKAEMKQSRISELEGMNYSSWSISTLERLARALGVGFKYSFVGWGELVPEIVGGLSREKLFVPSFENDPAFKEKEEPEPIAARIRTPTDYIFGVIQGRENTTPAQPWLRFIYNVEKQSSLGNQAQAQPESSEESMAQSQNPLAAAAAGGRR